MSKIVNNTMAVYLELKHLVVILSFMVTFGVISWNETVF